MLVGFVASGCAMERRGAFGSEVDTGIDVDQVRSTFEHARDPTYVPDARVYLTPVAPDAVARTKAASDPLTHPGIDAGVLALYQQCTHLACKVPWCASSEWFECPCHGAKYNAAGEHRAGPAPRGLDRFAVAIRDGKIVVDTRTILRGPPQGTVTDAGQAAGPHCT